MAGIVYSVLTVFALSAYWRFPDLSQGDAAVAEWLASGTNRGLLLGGLNAATIGSLMFLWFVAVIRRKIGDREDRFFATVFLGSALVYVGLWLVATSILAAPAVLASLRGAEAIDASATSATLGAAAAIMLIVAPRFQAVFVLSTSTVFLRSKRFPRWLAFLGYAVGLAMLIVPLVVDYVGIAFPIWVLIVSITILVVRSSMNEELEDAEGN